MTTMPYEPGSFGPWSIAGYGGGTYGGGSSPFNMFNTPDYAMTGIGNSGDFRFEIGTPNTIGSNIPNGIGGGATSGIGGLGSIGADVAAGANAGVAGLAGKVGAAGGAGSGWGGSTWDKVGLGIQGIQTLGSLWGAFQAAKLAKKQFKYTKDITETNLANQLKTYNTALTDRANNRAIVEGRTAAETQSYIDANKLSRTRG